MPHTSARRLLAPVLAVSLGATLLLAGCGSDAPTANPAPAGVTVGAAVKDKAPTVTLSKKPYAVTKTTTSVLTPGTGATLTADTIATLDLAVYNGKDGSTLDSTYEKTPASLYLGDATLLVGLKKGLTGQKVGSRLLLAIPPADGFGAQGNPNLKVAGTDTVLFVVDVVKATTMLKEATGSAVAPKAGLPTVVYNAGKAATITVPKGAKAPTKLVVQPLIEGAGPKVEAGQTVRASYTGALWRNNEVFDSSFAHDGTFDFQVGAGNVIKGWDTGVTGQKVGSRLLLVVPPAEGYGSAGSGDKIKGTDTLVFVLDILAAY